MNSAKHHLQSIQQLTDPPLDLNTALKKAKFLRIIPAGHLQMARWLRTNLKLSEEDIKHHLSKNPGILMTSSVSKSITKYAQSNSHYLSVAAAPLAALFDIWGLLQSHYYPASGLTSCMLYLTRKPEVDMVAGAHVQETIGVY